MRSTKRAMPVLAHRIACWTLAAFGLVAGGPFASHAAEQGEGGLDVVQIRPNFYMIAGAGGNIAVDIGVDGVVLANAGAESASDQVVAAIKKLTPLPIRTILDTNADADLVSGNGNLSKAGLTIFVNALGGAGLFNSFTNGGGAAIMAHDSVLRKMSAPTGKKSSFPVESWPTEAFLSPRSYIRMNDQAIEIFYQPHAHSDADSLVMFRKSDVVAVGDVLDTTRFPSIDIANGGSVQGEIEALNKVIELAVPPGPFIYEGIGTYVIPGHGRVCLQLDVVDYRDMVVEVRDAVEDMIRRDMTLDQIKAAHPALPYETEYGTEEGSTSAFVEAVYKSLTGKK
jgi:cyclase